MRKSVLSTFAGFAILAAVTLAEAQSLTVDIARARVVWTWAPAAGSGTLTGYDVRCGTATKVYTKITTYAANINQAPVKDVITGNGNWFCIVAAKNQFGEVLSNEVPFAAGAAPSGVLNLTVQAQ